MEFFREHKKIIVGFIALAFIVWMVAGVLIAMISMGR